MVNHIGSASHQLGCEKAKTERLERQIASLKLENTALQRQLDNTSKGSTKPNVLRNTAATNSEHSTTKSYLRPTAASLRRSEPVLPAETPPPSTIIKGAGGHIYTHDDAHLIDVTPRAGKIVNDGWMADEYSFLRSTQSSSRKMRPKIERKTQDEPDRDRPIPSPSSWDAFPAPFDRPVSGYVPEGTPDPLDKNPTLEQATRLDGSFWKIEPSKCVTIPSAFGWNLLNEAHGLAKGAFRSFSKTHLQGLYRQEFRGGDQDVRLEPREIDWYLDWYTPHGPMFASNIYVTRALRETRNLRNACSHYGGHSLSSHHLDNYLKIAQTLAVAVDDAPRAHRCRELREELGQKAADVYEEIMNLGYLSIISCQREWEPHHEAFLEKCSLPIDGYHCLWHHTNRNFSPVIGLAVQSFWWQKGEIFYAYDPDEDIVAEYTQKDAQEEVPGQNREENREEEYGEGQHEEFDQQSCCPR
ncbi:hypothetical protein PG996_006093 [Apiospora saccharicola]|uniref:Uncharacterized protein n=1 Tax=Apiospora saccharicola TaxID=335842 RepID=A0ABR1VNB4_9PEZI